VFVTEESSNHKLTLSISSILLLIALIFTALTGSVILMSGFKEYITAATIIVSIGFILTVLLLILNEKFYRIFEDKDEIEEQNLLVESVNYLHPVLKSK
jgi:heme A synthase